MAEEKQLMKGNEAIGEAAIRAGLRGYFGYPITPQNELIGYMAVNMIKHGRTFIQAESEIAAINMVYGAACTGARVMTSSSSPGMALKQEAMSYIAAADVPYLVVDVSRCGPGLGGITPAQGDYNLATKGGGHGDYRTLVFTPNSVQEATDLTYHSFDIAEKWRIPTMLLLDGLIGQMMEAVVLPPYVDQKKSEAEVNARKPWAIGDREKNHRAPNRIFSTGLDPHTLEQSIFNRFKLYEQIEKAEVRFEAINTEKADLILVAYGTPSRACKGAINLARAQGIELGLLRPITVWPFPSVAIAELAARGKKFLSVEMSMGQMHSDVLLAIAGKAPAYSYYRVGGVIPNEEEILAEALKIIKK